MSEIQKDIEAKAIELANEIQSRFREPVGEALGRLVTPGTWAAVLIANALAAERERCAKIADKFAAKPVRSKTVGQHDRTTSAAQTGKRIARAIRTP